MGMGGGAATGVTAGGCLAELPACWPGWARSIPGLGPIVLGPVRPLSPALWAASSMTWWIWNSSGKKLSFGERA